MSRRTLTLFGLCLMLALAPFAHAEGDLPMDTTDRWWGALGAALCGTGIRLATHVPVIGMNPWVLAPTIGSCLLAGLDLITS